MKIINLKDLSAEDYTRIMKRASSSYQTIMPKVKKIMKEVQINGDNALLQIGRKWYGKNYQSIQITEKEIKNAYKIVDKKLITSLEQMIKNITTVHTSQLSSKKESVVNPVKGISVWREWRPIEKVGLYIPGGKAAYPSSVLMTAIPAQIAGCNDIILCTPPRENGEIPAPTLVAADMIGVRNIFKVGGAEAIAAMTYGTETIPNVYKIFGAGNSFVTAAKIFALELVAIDMPAGPSEVFILADETANPAWIASDILADCEHGSDSSGIILIISTQKCAIAQNCVEEIERQIQNVSTGKRIWDSLSKYGAILISDDWDEALQFVNEYAPEHLEIMTKNPTAILSRIKNAGSIFLGKWTTKSAGDYATGANHILPTGGMAKMYPPLGVDAFGKWMQIQKCTKDGLSKIRKTVEVLSDVEQLPAHKMATMIRFMIEKETN